MKNILATVLLLISFTAFSQKNPAMMNSKELEAYKNQLIKKAEAQARQIAKQANMVFDESSLPSSTIKAPKKDVKRLAALPNSAPTQAQLLNQAADFEKGIKKNIAPSVLSTLDNSTAGKTGSEIQSLAMMSWYKNNQPAALYLGVKAAQKTPDSLNGWNNLAAMMNMSGLEHRAIPILQYCLKQKPSNSGLLNNMGQAYLGLGEVEKASQYLSKCLSVDQSHPEANRSMGVINMMKQDNATAAKFFAKEMETAHRRSSLAYLVKSGQRDKINLAQIRKRKLERQGFKDKDYFTSIALGKFNVPELPLSCDKTMVWQQKSEAYLQAVTQEYTFWTFAGEMSDNEKYKARHFNSGYYSELVEELLADLDATYQPIINLIDEGRIERWTQAKLDFYERMRTMECPQSPDFPSKAVMEAYAKKCCDLKKPVIDQFMTDYNKELAERIVLVQSRWKDYLNGMIGIVQLDPSPGNKKRVYAAVANYFTFLSSAVQAVSLEPMPEGCDEKLTSAQADSIILASKRRVDINCPEWLEFEIPIKAVTIKGSCESFGFEAELYEVFNVGYEKTFKTGTSTMYVGASVDLEVGMATVGASQQFYVVFDNNNQFADAGIKGGFEGSVADGLLKSEFGYDFSLNSGFNAETSYESEWVSNVEKAMTILK